MLLHDTRRAARSIAGGHPVPLTEQDRSLWDTAMVAEGVELLQAALAQEQ